ncbi:lantibiotic, gallidermin/nisin family [Parageobacillus thermantarcticus]|uniref:Lantibiotic n=1 Tax=Parageobacillus thermantarcticus TaxID=186116 RepID=A0A1I0TS97_9BACL|nr:gallidermin/nisin family lantibiotic [Parageobacillus thermantarcticus]WJQ12966.1 gallidermin/nisin family lantibiotic [Geobacillus stearothermophilus]SFA53876.1 lantibiotic, gallidermin/nisin family [Parageobacillus thermantarcticus]STO11666.1 Lantibiotic subtilin precursor [[Flavobacterium] thermophilum]
MAKFDDFDLDIVVKKQDNIVQPNITSKSLCTPGCITGILMCLTQNSCVSCNSCIRC